MLRRLLETEKPGDQRGCCSSIQQWGDCGSDKSRSNGEGKDIASFYLKGKANRNTCNTGCGEWEKQRIKEQFQAFSLNHWKDDRYQYIPPNPKFSQMISNGQDALFIILCPIIMMMLKSIIFLLSTYSTARHFLCNIAFNPPSTLWVRSCYLVPFSPWGQWGSEKLNKLPGLQNY